MIFNRSLEAASCCCSKWHRTWSRKMRFEVRLEVRSIEKHVDDLMMNFWFILKCWLTVVAWGRRNALGVWHRFADWRIWNLMSSLPSSHPQKLPQIDPLGALGSDLCRSSRSSDPLLRGLHSGLHFCNETSDRRNIDTKMWRHYLFIF